MSAERVKVLFDELLSITTEMADEHDAIFKAVRDLYAPWIVLKRDLNRLTALFGTGLGSTWSSDPDLLEPGVRRRLEEIVRSEQPPRPSP